MASQESSNHTSPDQNHDETLGSASESQWAYDDSTAVSQRPSTAATDSPAPSVQPGKLPPPLAKRRRVTRACDECRRKKIKCDGKQPCTHCTVYSYDCTYDQPSNRRRNPAPQYIEALELRLQKTEALLRLVAPQIDVEDPKFDALLPQQILAASNSKKEKEKVQEKIEASEAAKIATSAESGDESLLESMMDNAGTLDLDEQGHWDYHGQSSSFVFMRRFREQFKDLTVKDPTAVQARNRPLRQTIDSPLSFDSPKTDVLASVADLPSREVATELCKNALDQACSLMRFIHRPTFWSMFDRIYENPLELYGNEEHKFLPLLYSVLALGCLFEQTENSTLDVKGYQGAIEQGVQYFKIGRQMIDITDCRDLISLQTILMMIIFLQSSARLSTCYSYVGVALHSAMRLGLHRTFKANFNPIELEVRKRVFWTVRKMDAYVSALLGLPQLLDENDIDQEYPLEIDDEYITAEGILPMPAGKCSLMAGVNAHTRLICLLTKVIKYIYPIKAPQNRQNAQFDHSPLVSHAKIREVEKDLQKWMEDLPMDLRPSEDAPAELARVQQLLRSSYAYVQMILYRPFLHYVRPNAQGVDKRSYACAAACVSVSRNSVHITAQMNNRGLLTGAYWFSMFTTYFAILSLLYYVLENPDSTTSDELLKDAYQGRDTLASLAKRSLAADRCTQSLNSFFEELPEKIRRRKSTTATPKSRKRDTPSQTHSDKELPRPASQPFGGVQRARTFPMAVNATTEVRRTPSNAELEVHRNQLQDNIASSSTNSLSQVKWPRSNVSVHSADSMNSPQVNSDFLGSPQENTFSAADVQGIPFPDFTSMMFPSGDPFAYPNQPMSILEDGQFKGDQMPFSLSDLQGSNPFLQSNHSVPHPSFQGLHDPLFAPNSSFAMPTMMNGMVTPTGASSRLSISQLPTDNMQNADMMGMPPFWRQSSSQQQQQQQSAGQNSQVIGTDVNMNIDDLLGGPDEWGAAAWMDPGN